MAEIVVPLLIAIVLGGLVGIQRQASHKPAGLRTHAIVAAGACAFAMISHATGDDRIAAGVITGIGFLGAGAIVRSGLTAHGLTTAASIWAAAAVGLASGSGVSIGYAVAALLTVVTWSVLAFPDYQLVRRLPARRSLAIKVTFDCTITSREAVLAALGAEAVNVRENDDVEYRREGDGITATIGYAVTLRPGDAVARLLSAVTGHAGVNGAAVDDAVATS